MQEKNEVLAELIGEPVALKKSWGDLKGWWIPHDTRDTLVDFVKRWSSKTELAINRLVR